jgi:hypothetical protein
VSGRVVDVCVVCRAQENENLKYLCVRACSRVRFCVLVRATSFFFCAPLSLSHSPALSLSLSVQFFVPHNEALYQLLGRRLWDDV